MVTLLYSYIGHGLYFSWKKKKTKSCPLFNPVPKSSAEKKNDSFRTLGYLYLVAEISAISQQHGGWNSLFLLFLRKVHSPLKQFFFLTFVISNVRGPCFKMLRLAVQLQ